MQKLIKMNNNHKRYINTTRIVVESPVVIPAGTPKPFKITFPPQYNFVEKIAIIPVEVSADENYAMAFKKNHEEIVNMTHNLLYQMPKEVSPNERFLDVLEVVPTQNSLEVAVVPSKDIASGDKIEFDFIMLMTTEENYTNRLLDI